MMSVFITDKWAFNVHAVSL